MKSVHALPPDGLDTPLDALLTMRTEPGEPFAGWERVGDGPPRDPVAEFVKTALGRQLDPDTIVCLLNAAGLFAAWCADPVCLSCGQRGYFASPPRDGDTTYLDGACIPCRDRRERDAVTGRTALGERLEWLQQTRAGMQAARDNVMSQHEVAKGLFPAVSGPQPSNKEDQLAEYHALLPAAIVQARRMGGGPLWKANLASAFGWSVGTLSDRMRKAGHTMSTLKRRPGGRVAR